MPPSTAYPTHDRLKPCASQEPRGTPNALAGANDPCALNAPLEPDESGTRAISPAECNGGLAQARRVSGLHPEGYDERRDGGAPGFTPLEDTANEAKLK